MGAYVSRRILAAVGVLLLDVVLVFSLIHLIPGDPAQLKVGADDRSVAGNLDKVRRQLGLDRPLPEQFAADVGGLVRGAVGTSVFYKQCVGDMLITRIPTTFALALLSLIIGLVVALPCGVLAAVKRGSLWDQGFMLLALLGEPRAGGYCIQVSPGGANFAGLLLPTR